MPVIGWKLDGEQRSRLLERFAPAWPDVIADHITLMRVSAEDPSPPDTSAAIVGEVDDREGLQALVVALDGSTDRPDGGTYHITWSLDRARGRRAEQSNEVIAWRGWVAITDPVPVRVYPARWEWPPSDGAG